MRRSEAELRQATLKTIQPGVNTIQPGVKTGLPLVVKTDGSYAAIAEADLEDYATPARSAAFPPRE